MIKWKWIIACSFALLFTTALVAQRKNITHPNLVYVDKTGVLRYTQGGGEATFFGVNYTTPFAHAYRAHKRQGTDLKKAIEQDVYHLARLGLNAFRIHIWDTEISDTAGNLIANEKLDLFDYLLGELKKRKIKTVITPIAFWGNGYPERDEATPGFARKYGKGGSTTNDTAIAAQEKYLVQFFRHINPYTGLTYLQDPDVIAVEINNEPSHSGPKEGVTNYINRLAAALRSTGWNKPVYYNISQSPYYADAVAKGNIDGVSFQWYPTGLVANRQVAGNFLPHVNQYSIPYDTIPAYRNKSRMIYEFDAADVLKPYLYPAMAKSFKRAGFQWATQFAYDPMAIAHVNTEYQTHYLNLAYTPAKAISFMIAAEVFKATPRLESTGQGIDTAFGPFRVSYTEALSEMNTATRFLYSGSTLTNPVSAGQMEQLAGVGNSAVVKYPGLGAYFLDKVAPGVWRLEVMPDAVSIRDPFEKASPNKEVTIIQWRNHPMQITLPDLGNNFEVTGLNKGNEVKIAANGTGFTTGPGVYMLSSKGAALGIPPRLMLPIGMKEFVAPPHREIEIPMVRHEPVAEVSARSPFTIKAIVLAPAGAKVMVQATRLGGGGGPRGGNRPIEMKETSPYHYETVLPQSLLEPGQVNYRLIVQHGENYHLFPGAINENPAVWDSYSANYYSFFAVTDSSAIYLFDPTTDRPLLFPNAGREFQTALLPGLTKGTLLFSMTATLLQQGQTISFQHYMGKHMDGRKTELANNKYDMVITARNSMHANSALKITLITKNGDAYSTTAQMSNEWQAITVDLSKLKPDSYLLLPRPYPGFMALKAGSMQPFTGINWEQVEKIEVSFGTELDSDKKATNYAVEVANIKLMGISKNP